MRGFPKSDGCFPFSPSATRSLTAGNIRYQAVAIRVVNLKHAVYSEAAKKEQVEQEAQTAEREMSGCIAS
jgi:hypothetical protein